MGGVASRAQTDGEDREEEKAVRCRKCQGQLEPIIRGEKFVFNFCRPCKLTYSKEGYLEVSTGQLSSRFNPLSSARDIIGKTNAGATSVTRTALEVFLMNGLWESYFQGLKDGVLLAYSQDVEEGEPLTTEGESNGSVSSTPGNSDKNK